jgi:hypothetical protein
VAKSIYGETVGSGMISISPLEMALTITTANLPSAKVNEVYYSSLAATGGSGTYSWSLVGGSIGGLVLNDASQITGTPTKPGKLSFTVLVTDSNCKTATKSLSIKVNK